MRTHPAVPVAHGDLAADVDGTPLTRLEPISFQVRFPRTDVGEVTARLLRHKRGDRVALGRPSWAAITIDGD